MSGRTILFCLIGMWVFAGKTQVKEIMQEMELQSRIEKSAAQLKMQALAAPENFSKASSNFDIHYFGFNWFIDPAVRYISGSAKIGFTISQRTNIITLDLMDELRVDSIFFKNAKISSYRPFDNTLIVNLSVFLEPGTKGEIEIFYKGIPPNSTGPFNSFVNSAHAGVPVMWTLSEPYGSRDWFPCKNGLNDKTDSVDITITTPEAYIASANGVFDKEILVGGFRTRSWKHRYPIATYLIAIAATNYQILEDQVQLGTTTLPLTDYAYPESVSVFRSASPLTKRTLQLLHNNFTPYPYLKEKYGHTQFGFGGGMEHQTNSFMGSMSETLIVHEAAHQWFGNKITCGSWKDIWLNEGYAVFCVNYNIEKNYSEQTLLNLYRSQINNITSRPNGSVYVDDTTSVSRIFDSRLSYNKGGWVLQMLRWKIGDSAFFRATRNYLNDPQLLASGYAKTPDLKKHFERESGTDLTEFFKDWVYGQGFPSYQLEWAIAGENWIQTNLSQVTSDTSVSFFEMPVPIRFKNAKNDTTLVIQHTQNGQIDLFKIGFIPDSAFIDPKFKLVSANNKITRAQILPGSENVVVFPNPVNNQFSVLLKNMTEGELNLSIYNALGELVWRRRVGNFKGEDLIVVPFDQMPRGSYWLKVNREQDPPIMKPILK